MTIAAIAVAGALGALSRYGLTGAIVNRYPTAFPWGTLAVNVSGSFVLGLVFVLLTERLVSHPTLRVALTVGFLSSFTTFSTFSLETLRLFEGGATGLALLNIFASVAACLLAVYVGVQLGRTL